MITLNLRQPVQVFRALHVDELRHGHTDHEHLPDFFFQRELLQRFLRPLFAVAVKMYWGRTLKVASRCRREQGQQTKAGERQLLRHHLQHGATITEMATRIVDNVAHHRTIGQGPLISAAIDIAGAPRWLSGFTGSRRGNHLLVWRVDASPRSWERAYATDFD